VTSQRKTMAQVAAVLVGNLVARVAAYAAPEPGVMCICSPGRITCVAGRWQARRYPALLSRSMVEHCCMMMDLVAADLERVT
jgi:hypothetical protein